MNSFWLVTNDIAYEGVEILYAFKGNVSIDDIQNKIKSEMRSKIVNIEPNLFFEKEDNEYYFAKTGWGKITISLIEFDEINMIDTKNFNSHFVIGYLNYQWFYISPDKFPGAYNFYTKAKELSQDSSFIHAVFSTKDLTKPLALYYQGFQYDFKDE